MVLDDGGTWVPLESRLDVEKKVLERLSEGRVICQGQWIPILEAKIKKGGVAPPQDTKTRLKAFIKRQFPR